MIPVVLMFMNSPQQPNDNWSISKYSKDEFVNINNELPNFLFDMDCTSKSVLSTSMEINFNKWLSDMTIEQ